MGEKDTFLIAVDGVVFTIAHHELQILLIQRDAEPFKGIHALPGGFLRKEEELEDTIKRKLYEEANIKDIFLKKLHPFGKKGRDPRGRVITIPYMALISSDKLEVKPRAKATAAGWFCVYHLPELAFDHKEIIEDSLHHLRFEVQSTNLAYQLLSDKFTLTELQQAYEIILNQKLDKRNFRKRLLALGIVKSTTHYKREGAHRPAQLYTFKDRQYSMLKEKINISFS